MASLSEQHNVLRRGARWSTCAPPVGERPSGRVVYDGTDACGGFTTATLQRMVLCLRREQKPCVVGLTVNTLHDSVPRFSAPKLPLAITGFHHAAGV